MRDHGQQLREMTNDIFTHLKNMRKELDTEVDRVSKELADKFNKKLDEVEEKVKSGLGSNPSSMISSACSRNSRMHNCHVATGLKSGSGLTLPSRP
jgi:gas vesicle protein